MCQYTIKSILLLVNNNLLKQPSLRLHSRRSPLLLRPPHERKENETNDRDVNKLLVKAIDKPNIATLLETLRQLIVVETVIGIPTIHGKKQSNIVAMPEHS